VVDLTSNDGSTMIKFIFLFYLIPAAIPITIMMIATNNKHLAKLLEMKDNEDLISGILMSLSPIFNIIVTGLFLKELIKPVLDKTGFFKSKYY
jgi:hypothetical protein